MKGQKSIGWVIILIVKVGVDKEFSSKRLIGKEESKTEEKGDYFGGSGGK